MNSIYEIIAPNAPARIYRIVGYTQRGEWFASFLRESLLRQPVTNR
jgi:hypothetical protein